MYEHPGRLFIEKYGPLRYLSDVIKYTTWLREEAGVATHIPVDLELIRQRFSLPPPILAPLPNQQGLLFDGNSGLILLNDGDSSTRQRFSYAHELMELLFEASREHEGAAYVKTNFIAKEKENWCEQGAAALLMPVDTFTQSLANLGSHFEAATQIASLYNTSLLATLVQVVRYSTAPHILILCRNSLKPSEQRYSSEQMRLPFFEAPSEPLKKLRVGWAVSNAHSDHDFVPKHKSIPPASCIATAYETDSFQRQKEPLFWGKNLVQGLVEAKRITIGAEACVIALYHLQQVQTRPFDTNS